MKRKYGFLKSGYGIIFLTVNGITIFWAQLASVVMERLERREDLFLVLAWLPVFAVCSLFLYLAALKYEKVLSRRYENTYMSGQMDLVQQSFAGSGVEKKQSELELINRVKDDWKTIFDWEAKTKTEFLLSGIVCVVIFVLLSMCSIEMALFIYVICLINIAVPLLYDKYMIADYSQVMQANDGWAKRLQEGIQNYSALKSMLAEEDYARIYERDVWNFITAVKGANRTVHMEQGVKNGFAQFTNYLLYALVVFFLIWEKIDLAAAAKALLLIPLLQNILSLVVQKYGARRNVVVARMRIREMMNQKPRQEKKPEGYDVHIDNIRFSYEGQEDLFHGLSFEIHQGDFVLIKGANGTGKSTFLKLLTGLYQVQEGQFLIGGVSSSEVPVSWLQENIFYFPQSNLLIPGTVKENMELREIKLHDDFALKQYLETDISNLSEGQKKQLILEELFQTKKKIFLLDEPENHLDTDALRRLTEFLEKTNRTVLVVTHVEQFDSIADKVLTL